MKRDWTQDPDAILEVALAHCLWEPEFRDRLVTRIAQWAHENPQHRDELRERLKMPAAGQQQLPLVRLAATLSRYNDLVADGLTPEDALSELSERLTLSTKTVEKHLAKARKALAAGELNEWALVFKGK